MSSNTLNGNSDFWLANGGRIYFDLIGNLGHLEWATAEHTKLDGLTAQEAAGRQILIPRLVSSFSRQHNISDGIWVFANNTDYHLATTGDDRDFYWLNSWGYHENYSISPFDHADDDRWTALLPFLATRQIFAGPGTIVPSHLTKTLDSQFLLSARSANSILLSRTFHPDGLGIHKLYDADSGPRTHLVLGDTNISEYQTKLKIGTTALILRLLAQTDWQVPKGLSDCTQQELVSAARKIAQFSSGRPQIDWEITLESRSLNAVDVQWLFYEGAEQHFKDSKDPDTRWVLAQWHKVLEVLPFNFRDLIDLDWVLKWNFREKYKFDPQDLVHFDMSYHLIYPQKQALDGFVAAGGNYLLPGQTVLQAAQKPPRGTRAFGRGNLIKDITDYFGANPQPQLTHSGLSEDHSGWNKVVLHTTDPRINFSYEFPHVLSEYNQANEAFKTHLATVNH